VRAQVLAYARRERAAGQSWQRIGRAVGVSASALKNWSRMPRPARTLVPVRLAAAPTGPASTLVLVSPSGYRVEGLDLATASALLRALG
jgi:hypothetical protein